MCLTLSRPNWNESKKSGQWCSIRRGEVKDEEDEEDGYKREEGYTIDLNPVSTHCHEAHSTCPV
jgi:predicted NUDIX family NTP pyrophosphohydrolase